MNNKKEIIEKSLKYHEKIRPGKIEVIPSKECNTADDLSLAYTPGVAYPCLEIKKDPSKAALYTAKQNLVGVISNGSAVLGLGNIGALAGKPVMEGKGVLFKRFADIDVFDIELDESDPNKIIEIVKSMEPTFGGINLEDIKAPECFQIESELIKKMNIPVFHDDQHGTAIITAAAFLNALEISGRDIATTKTVFSGAGAASIACAELLIELGLKKNNLIMCDSKGVINNSRTDNLNEYKKRFISSTNLTTISEAMNKADAFIGVSVRGVISKEMVKSMNDMPIVFAMANPEPEIYPDEVYKVKKDALMATGRSDFPNQVNNVLGFPFIFRGALDVRATKINNEMKIAAVHALKDLAKESVPDVVKKAYGGEDFTFGPNYLIPKPFDERVLIKVAPAVAKAAMESKVSTHEITDFKGYEKILRKRVSKYQRRDS